MVSGKKFNWKRILTIIITTIFIFCAVSMVATKLIYDSIFNRYDEPAAVSPALSEMVQGRKEHSFPSGENALTGYYYAVPEGKERHGLIVLAPGFHAGADDYLWQIRELGDFGWGVFTYDTTGTLRSQGKNQIGFPQAISDLEAALKYVEKQGNFGYNDVVLLGHSRGAYAACCVLEERDDVAAVVSVSGINSAMEGIMHMSSQVVGPVSYGNYGFLWLYQAMLFGADTLNLQADEVLSKSDVPTLVVHGTLDSQVPMDSCSIISHREEITSGQVEYLLCDGGHTDLLYGQDGTANDALMEDIHHFLLRSIEE